MRTGSPMSRTYVAVCVRHPRRLEDQAHGLLDGHEVPGHLGMGHGHRRPGSQLLPDDRQEGAPTAQDVPEADRREDGRRPLLGRQDHLGEPLRAPSTEVGFAALSVETRTNRSVSWVIGGVHEVVRADDVRLHSLARVPFEAGQVLERRGVEDHVRTARPEHLVDPVGVTDVGDDEQSESSRASPATSSCSPVQVGLVVVDHDRRRGPEARDLSAQLAADGPAGPGDEHALARDRVRRHPAHDAPLARDR